MTPRNEVLVYATYGTSKWEAANHTLCFVYRPPQFRFTEVFSDLGNRQTWEAYQNELHRLTYTPPGEEYTLGGARTFAV